MKVIVSDSSPIRSLYFLRLLSILPELFGEVVIPPAVLHELETPASGLTPIPRSELGVLSVVAPNDQSKVQELQSVLDKGESEALVLAIELGVSIILMDETRGRAMARRLGLSALGVIGIFIKAKRANMIGEIKPLLLRLRSENNFYISDALMRDALTSVGEQ